MISLAITNYNRSGWVIESFIQVLNNDYVGEIVIVDDCSDEICYYNLCAFVSIINNPKIKLFRNDTNLGLFLNKRKSVELCSNEYVIVFDSDNVLDNDYIEIVKSINKESDMLYCPEILYDTSKQIEQWSYKEFSDIIIDRYNINTYMGNVNFETLLNSGNYFVHRNTFLLSTASPDEPISEISGGDTIYINYLWILAGNRIKSISGLGYIHRMHDKSYYLININQSRDFNYKVCQKIKAL